MYSANFPGRSSIHKFKRFEGGIDTEALLNDFLNGRKCIAASNNKPPPAHSESTHIGLRIPTRTGFTKNFYHGNILRNQRTKEYASFPELTSWIESFAAERNATLERAFIAILKPHGKVHCHFDAGIYFSSRERYHLVLQSEGTTVFVENERAFFQEGEVWWFNNRLYHEFSHTSNEERVHVIFDLRPKSFSKRAKNILIWAYLYYIHRLQGAGKTGGPPKSTG